MVLQIWLTRSQHVPLTHFHEKLSLFLLPLKWVPRASDQPFHLSSFLFLSLLSFFSFLSRPLSLVLNQATLCPRIEASCLRLRFRKEGWRRGESWSREEETWQEEAIRGFGKTQVTPFSFLSFSVPFSLSLVFLHHWSSFSSSSHLLSVFDTLNILFWSEQTNQMDRIGKVEKMEKNLREKERSSNFQFPIFFLFSSTFFFLSPRKNERIGRWV